MVLNTNTPLEVYELKGRKVWVKRDDLMGDGETLPPWGKIEAIYNLVDKYVDRSKPLTHLVVNGSWSGWALAAICEELGIEFIYSYPDNKVISQVLIEKVKKLHPKTIFNPIQNNIQDIMYAQLKNSSVGKWQLLPYAFNHKFYIDYMEKKMEKVLEEKSDFKHLVVSSGEGVTSAGLIKKFVGQRNNFWEKPDRHAWSTCVSSYRTVKGTYVQHNVYDPTNVHIEKSSHEFNDRLDSFEAPFPCNQFWDIKQWKWLSDNIEKLDGDILFWNIGARWIFS